jgi:anthranilate synthase component 1
MPEIRFSFYDSIVAFDHLRQEIVLIVNIRHEPGSRGLRTKYADAIKHLKQMSNRLMRQIARPEINKRSQRSKAKALTTQASFEKVVRRAKKHIKEGDIFQVVLSQRWEIESRRGALDVYRRLRRLNPSPYMFLLDYGDEAVVGSSPEMMVRIEGDSIETRPIAGTRQRGANAGDDQKQIEDLLRDEKELAEHTMLLDLGRNDIGRVSLPGTVEVRDKMMIEKYSHVIHIVSSVAGKLSSSESPIDGHFSCFPAGTVSGAPKIRAMQIIDDLESERRGIYAGSIAYLDFFGNLDSCIAIRTLVKKGSKYYVQAGAGIVADSQPRREFRETQAKAEALIEAVAGAD